MLATARALLRQQHGLAASAVGSFLGGASYATAAPQDYALALQQAHELTKVKLAANKEVGFLTGVPLETFKRHVRIYVPTRSPEQAAYGKTLHVSNHSPSWKLEFAPTAKWENPLIGWTSSADPLDNVARAALAFYTKEEAMAFCDKLGFEYEVEEPLERRTARPKKFVQYGDNYSVKRKGYPDLSHLPSNRVPAGP